MSVLFAGGGTPGGTVVGATDRKGFAAIERVLAPENFVVHRVHEARHRPRQDPVQPAGPPVAPRQRPHADQRVDVMRSSANHRDTETQREQEERSLFKTLPSLCLLSSLCLCVSVVSTASAAPPAITYLYPAGAQRGTTVEVTAAGTFDAWPAKVWASGKGVSVEAGEGQAQGQRSRRTRCREPTGCAPPTTTARAACGRSSSGCYRKWPRRSRTTTSRSRRCSTVRAW